jgi:hypothetical protein
VTAEAVILFERAVDRKDLVAAGRGRPTAAGVGPLRLASRGPL